MVTKNKTKFRPCNQGCREDWGGPGQKEYRLCEGGLGVCPPGNFEILNSLKCVLGAPKAVFCTCTQCIYTCKLPSSISGFRSKSMTYRALASRLQLCIIVHYFASAA